ncbi:hypothetical protein DRN76_03420 [Methanosarcinales archaeon]|nr:MAG: hypothetical protein DRN76_03420 [Methanosarcinales archaeon]
MRAHRSPFSICPVEGLENAEKSITLSEEMASAPSTSYHSAIFCNSSFVLIPAIPLSLPKVHANKRIF